MKTDFLEAKSGLFSEIRRILRNSVPLKSGFSSRRKPVFRCQTFGELTGFRRRRVTGGHALTDREGERGSDREREGDPGERERECKSASHRKFRNRPRERAETGFSVPLSFISLCISPNSEGLKNPTSEFGDLCVSLCISHCTSEFQMQPKCRAKYLCILPAFVKESPKRGLYIPCIGFLGAPIAIIMSYQFSSSSLPPCLSLSLLSR